MDTTTQIIIVIALILLISGIITAIVFLSKSKNKAPKQRELDAPLPSQARKTAPRPGTSSPISGAASPVHTPPVSSPPTPTVAGGEDGYLTETGVEEEEDESMLPPEELDDWGEDIAIDDGGADLDDYQEEEEKPVTTSTPQFDDDDDDYGGVEDDNFELIAKELEDISAGTRQAFTQAIIEKEFSISKMREADAISQKCVRTYLDENEIPNPRKVGERLFVIHPKIQVSDLPEFAESYLDDGSETNQRYFSELEEICEQHEESVLDLFLQFNSTLPEHLKCSIVGEVRRPEPGVVFMAPEWDDGDFAKPDFGEDEEDISDDDDFYEDYYDDLEEIDENDDDR